MTQNPDYQELLTVADFEAALAAGESIVITDESREPMVHRPECQSITREAFVEKVIENDRKTGAYFRARNTRIAEDMVDATRCSHCY